MISEEMNLLLLSLSRRKSLAQIEGAMVETEITNREGTQHVQYVQVHTAVGQIYEWFVTFFFVFLRVLEALITFDALCLNYGKECYHYLLLPMSM